MRSASYALATPSASSDLAQRENNQNSVAVEGLHSILPACAHSVMFT